MARDNSAQTKKAKPFDLSKARELFKEKMRALKGVPVVNKSTGIVAQVGKAGRSKTLSDKAISKSVANGFSAEQHFEAAMNIQQLFEDSGLFETRADNNQEKNVLSIKYFQCETEVMGEKAIAQIMAKEISEMGHRIYTIELLELNKPTELAGRTDINPSAGSKDSAQMSQIADSLSATKSYAKNISQSEGEGKENSQFNELEESTKPIDEDEDDESGIPILLPNGNTIYETYLNDKKFLDKLVKDEGIPRWQMIERNFLEGQPRESLKREAERKYYDYVKQHAENGIFVPANYKFDTDYIAKDENGKDEYTARLKGDFESDEGKRVLKDLTELAEKFGGTLKNSSADTAGFYFGRKIKDMNAFKVSVKLYRADNETSESTVGNEESRKALTTNTEESPSSANVNPDREHQELNKPTELENRAEIDSSADSKDSAQMYTMSSTQYAEESSNENISQSEGEGKEEPTAAESKIKFPEGALTLYGDEKATESFKRDKYMLAGKIAKFDENMARKVKVNGVEMTRLEMVEGVAKGEIDESAVKLNKEEREYLQYLNERLIEPLKAIQKAGMQNETSPKSYDYLIETTILLFGSKNSSVIVFKDKELAEDSTTLSNLTKLAKSLGGGLTQDSSGKYYAYSKGDLDSTSLLSKTISMFLDNRHLKYFEGKKEFSQNKTSENESEPVATQNLLENLFDSVNVEEEFTKLMNATPINVTTEISRNADEGQLRRDAVAAFSEQYPQGARVNTLIGEVIISRRSIRDSLGHSLYNSKADAVLSLPEGMNNAAYIGSLNDFSGNDITNHYFVYPIQYEEQKNYVLCRVRENSLGERRFYIHDIFSEQDINEESNALSQTQPPTNRQVQLRGVALYRRILSNFFIRGKENFDSTNSEGVNSYVKWDNDVDRGQRPRLLEDSTKELQGQSGLGLGRTLRSRTLDEGNEESNRENQGERTRSKKLAELTELVERLKATSAPIPFELYVSKSESEKENITNDLIDKLETTFKNYKTAIATSEEFSEIYTSPNSAVDSSERAEVEKISDRLAERVSNIQSQMEDTLETVNDFISVIEKPSEELVNKYQAIVRKILFFEGIVTDKNAPIEIPRKVDNSPKTQDDTTNEVNPSGKEISTATENQQKEQTSLPKNISTEDYLAEITAAIEKLKAAHNFSSNELEWISIIKTYLKYKFPITVAVFDEDKRYRQRGGFKRINKIFGGQLAQIIDELNGYLSFGSKLNEESTPKNYSESATENQQEEKVVAAPVNDEVQESVADAQINPFEGEHLIPKDRQSEQYKKAFSKMEVAWEKYKQGTLDIEEMLSEAEKVLTGFQESFDDNGKYTIAYQEEYDSLAAIKRKFEDEKFSDAVQSAKKNAWENFQALWGILQDAEKSGKISAEVADKLGDEAYKIAKRVQQRKHSAIKGYDELKKLLFGVVDVGTSSIEYKNNDGSMIRRVLNAPVGTRIAVKLVSRFGGREVWHYYEITEHSENNKMLRPVDENGNRTQFDEIPLSLANVKKHIVLNNWRGAVTLTLPDSVVENLPKAEKKVSPSSEKENAPAVTKEQTEQNNSEKQESQSAEEVAAPVSDEIENRAREALKAARLEGKTAPEGYYTQRHTFNENEEQVAVWKNNRTEKATPESLKQMHQNLAMLAKNLNGKKMTDSRFVFSNLLDADIFQRAVDIYLGNEGAKKNESGQLGESRSVDGGHQRVQPNVREAVGEGTRQEGRDKVSEGVLGQQRQDAGKSEENVDGTNAENDRSTSETSAGESSRNGSSRNGVRGDTRTVHTTGRDDGRTDKRALGTTQTVKENVNDKVTAYNYHITEDSGIGVGGLKTKFKQNLDAIKLLKKIESEGRTATPSEQTILAKFNGWGTVAAVFSSSKDWEKERQQLKEILTGEEYESASRATPNAFYTSPEIAQAIWEGIRHLGFEYGRVLDPSMGSGIFFGTMPLGMKAHSELTGVELDDLTGRIAKQLYPDAAIDIMGFQDRKLPSNYYDLAISNVPFGTIRYQYNKQTYNIHNFFFAKAMDAVRPGGLVAFITGTGTMQAGQDAAVLRAVLNGQADLIAAFKLPSQTFDKNAGTQVTSDILILQKRLDSNKPSEHAQDWVDVGQIYLEVEHGSYKYQAPFGINEYFNKNPQNMIGKPVVDKLQAGARLGLDGKGRDITKEPSALMNKLPEKIYTHIEFRQHSGAENMQKVIREFSQRQFAFVVRDDSVYQQTSTGLVEISKGNHQKVRDFLRLAKALENVLNEQLSNPNDDKLTKLQQNLNDVYENFVKNNGYINAMENIRVLGSDPRFSMTAALEDYREDKKSGKVTVKKSDTFFKRTLGAVVEPSSADNIEDALSLSMSFRGGLNIDYMAKLLGKTPAQVIEELGENVFENPVTQIYELAEEYLSGNVREKLAVAEEAAKTNPKYKRNVEALRDTRIQPTDLDETQISVNIGASWVDESYYTQFIEHMLGKNSGYSIKLDRKLGKWRVEYSYSYTSESAAKNSTTWGVEGVASFTEIMDRLLNAKSLEITFKEEYFEDGKKKTRTLVNQEKTAAVKQKAREIQQEFEKWLWDDADRKSELLRTYNVIFNSITERKYDGSLLTFPSLNPSIKLYPHQKNAVWRIMQGKNVLLAHCVGAGKTYTMIVSAMEMKRLGKIRKPLFAVPNNIVGQFEKEFLQAYPSAKLLVIQASDLPSVKLTDTYDDKLNTRQQSKKKKGETGEYGEEDASENDSEVLDDEVPTIESSEDKQKRLAKRGAMLSRIATEDWDGIIISHEMLKRLPMSPSTYNQFYREQLTELENSYKALVASGEKGSSVKDIQTAIANLKEKLKRDIKEDEKEIVIPFEQLGIDQIYVDESDKFKNLRIVTAMNRISGLQINGSQRATEMYVKTKWLTEQRNGGGVVFASGTPVSNTLGEIYTLMRFLDGKTLKEKGMEYFDLWAGNFTEKQEGVELNPNGNGFRSTTFLTMTNLIANSKMLRQFADIKFADELPHLERPTLKNGARTIIEVEPTEDFNEFKLKLLARAEALKHRRGKPKKGEDNMLSITSDFRSASIDLQLVMSEIEETASGNKIPVLCDVIKKKYDETADIKGTQVVFCDLGTPNGKRKKGGKKSVYEKIKERLVRSGITANQIAFVHDAKGTQELQTLFEKVNAGEVRVIIGSTEKMGAGTNFQKHLVALHHVDCCWKPRDIEQREGRILRKGNLNKEVEIFTYVVKGSYDGNMWEKVTNKQRMIDSVLRGDPLVNKVADSENSMTFGEVQAAALDNPLMKERTEVANKLAELEVNFRAYRNQQLQAGVIRDDLVKRIPTLERQIEMVKADIAARKDTRGDAFQIKIGDRVYTDRTKANDALQEAIRNFREASVTKIGEIGGFDINFRLENLYVQKLGALEVAQRQVVVTLMNHGTYRVKANSIAGIETTLRSTPDNQLKEDTSKLEKDKAKLVEVEKQLGKPFAQQKEMEETRRKLEEIDRKLENPAKDTFYIDGKELSKQDAIQRSFEERYNVLQSLVEDFISKIGAGSAIENYESSRDYPHHIRVEVEFEVGGIDESGTGFYFAELKDAIACARYIRENFGDRKLIRFRGASVNRNDYSIDANGVEEVKTNEAKNAVTELDKEKSATKHSQTGNGNSQVQNTASSRKKQTQRGKWHTIGSASSREELQKLFNEKGMGSATIQKDGSIVTSAGDVLENRIRIQRGRWQYGYYENSKNSITGNGSTQIGNIVADENLTEPLKLLKNFGKAIGANVVFFSNSNKDFHGAYEDGDIYLNVNSARSLTQTFLHETFHWLSANNPNLFSEMAKAAGITEAQLENYLERTGRTDVKKTSDVTEEVIADSMSEILNRVARKDKSLVERFFAWLKDMFSKFKNFFQNPKGKLTRGQYAKMADVFGKMATKLTDSEGKKIFRYNTRTHNLELANGESLESLLQNEVSSDRGFFDLDDVSLAGAKFSRTGEDNTAGTFDEDGEISQAVFDRCGLNEAQRNMVRDAVEKEIGAHVDISKMSDPVARDKAREDLPYLKRLRTQYLRHDVQSRPDRKDYFAAKIEYARRCFENAERIRAVSANAVVGNERQRGVYKSRTSIITRNDPRGTGEIIRRSDGGVSRSVSGEKKGAREHFLKLYEEEEKRRSEKQNQGVINLGAKFSIGSDDSSGSSSDNSSEGFLQRVKNLLTGRPNQSNERIRKRINTMLSNLTGVKIAAGHMNNGMDIVVKDIEKVIRTNRAYDWANLLPAVGQKISVIISLRPSESMNNYIADWLMTGALNNTSAEETEFAKALRKEENFEICNQLLEIQSTFYEWRNMTPSERIQATIEFERPKPSLRERAKSAKDESYQQFFEELEPVNDLVKEWEKITGEKLADAVNPYVLFRNYRGIAGRAKLLIEGDGTVINALRQMFPNLKWDGFKTIKMILSDVGALENEKTRREFSAFCEAKHVKDLFNKNREIQANMKKVQDRITELEGMKSQTTDAKRIKDLDRRINQNQEKFKTLEESLYRTPFSEADCDAMIRDYAQKYGQAQKDLVSFSRKTLAILRDSGVISDQAYIEMARAWKNYVPMHRVFDDNEDVRFGDSLKKMVGSDRDTVDPLQSIIRNTYDYIRRAEKNTAKLMLASMARTGGVGMLVEEVDGKQPDDKTTIAFFENGVKKYLQTDVSVVRAVNNMSPPQMSWFMKFIRIGTMLLRNFATVFNPAFAARNLVRDWQDAALYSKYGFFSPMDFVRGFIHAVKQDDVYSEWMAAGGAQASFWSVDRDYTEASINSLTKQGLKKYTSLKGFLDLFSRLGEWSELGTRIGYFEKAKKELAKNNGGIINRADLVTAALESRDLMDFARGGTASRTWNNAVAFANASLQGWDKFFRTFDFRKSWSKDPQVRKEWLRAMFRLALTSVVPAVLCFLLNYDDDWYKNDLKDYEKQNYWILGENLRIPKGMDLGTRFFSNLTEEILNSTYNKDPKAFTSFWKPFVDSMPGLIPTGLAPIWENFTNYDMFRQRAIVPQYLQKLPAASQYNANTTSIAKFIGETANISPLKVDHFIFGYTGNMGREILRVGETVTGFRDYNFKFPKDLPLIGGFFRMPLIPPPFFPD